MKLPSRCNAKTQMRWRSGAVGQGCEKLRENFPSRERRYGNVSRCWMICHVNDEHKQRVKMWLAMQFLWNFSFFFLLIFHTQGGFLEWRLKRDGKSVTSWGSVWKRGNLISRNWSFLKFKVINEGCSAVLYTFFFWIFCVLTINVCLPFIADCLLSSLTLGFQFGM